VKLVSHHKVIKPYLVKIFMENKYVGYLLIGVSVLITIIVFMFQSALKSFVGSSCTLAHGGSYCPMTTTINQQTYLALGIVGILVLVGIVLILSKPHERLIIKTKTIERKPQKRVLDTTGLKPEEKQILKLIQENKTIFQGDIIEKAGFSKAKVTRIIDRLEGKGFVERKRRGLTNVVVFKE